MTSRRAFGYLCATVLVMSTAAAFAGSASATTSPGSVLNLQVTITDSQIRLDGHKAGGRYVSPGGHAAQFPRGVIIRFTFTNKGTKTYVPAILFTNSRQANPYAPKPGLTTALKVAPGHHVGLMGDFYFRGAFNIEKLFNKKPQGRPVKVTIY
jgi:hypothetical protein